jgi:2-oxoglutarate ferredoxin oxidoreductase subunit alpha
MPIPGGPGAYVANGSEHDEIGDTTHLPDHHIRLTERRFKKLELLKDAPYEIEGCSGVALMPCGSSKGPSREAYDRLIAEGVDISWIYSLSLNPLPDEVFETLKKKDLVIVPELNYLGQWSSLLRQDGINAISITQYTGLPFKPGDLAERIKQTLDATEKVGATR